MRLAKIGEDGLSEGVPEGASLPEGIDVDDAAAYFGVVESSDALQQMMAMESKQALSKALEHLSDIILQPGEFDFEAASERLQCEGGEIYYLIFGHLNLMALPDPLLQFSGQSDSTGAENSAHPLATEEVIRSLEPLFDPMQFLKILAIAFTTGGVSEVDRYLKSIEELMAKPSENIDKMQTMAEELNSALDVAGHVLPMSMFASEGAQPAEIEIGPAVQVSEPSPKEKQIATPLPEPETIPEAAETKAQSVPLPHEPTPSPIQSVPLPKESPPVAEVSSVPLPEQKDSVPDEGFKNEVEEDYAAQDAFAGAFGSQLVPESSEVKESVDEPIETLPEPVEEIADVHPESIEDTTVPLPEQDPVLEDAVEDEWVSDAERFIAADVDESGSLSVEELAVAANVSMEEAQAMHTEADTDGDGEVSLSEFVSSDAAKKMSTLPRPIAPVRKPIQSQQPVNPAQPQPTRQQPASPGIAAPNMGWQQPQQQQPPPQQPAMNIQPTIRSGIHCRGCGIGLDPHWRFCPVCGNMNVNAHR